MCIFNSKYSVRVVSGAPNTNYHLVTKQIIIIIIIGNKMNCLFIKPNSILAYHEFSI